MPLQSSASPFNTHHSLAYGTLPALASGWCLLPEFSPYCRLQGCFSNTLWASLTSRTTPAFCSSQARLFTPSCSGAALLFISASPHMAPATCGVTRAGRRACQSSRFYFLAGLVRLVLSRSVASQFFPFRSLHSVGFIAGGLPLLSGCTFAPVAAANLAPSTYSTYSVHPGRRTRMLRATAGTP